MPINVMEQSAYHESGHIVMAYLAGFRCLEVKLTNTGNAYSKFDYGSEQMTLLIAAMTHYETDPHVYDQVSPALRIHIDKVAKKAVAVLVGGAVSEALYKSGIGFDGELPIEISGPDLVRIRGIDKFLSERKSTHSQSFVSDELAAVTAIIKSDSPWKAIQHLANAIQMSSEKQLHQEQIEASLLESGYLDFIR